MPTCLLPQGIGHPLGAVRALLHAVVAIRCRICRRRMESCLEWLQLNEQHV